jgi:hypothetical protein
MREKLTPCSRHSGDDNLNQLFFITICNAVALKAIFADAPRQLLGVGSPDRIA